MTHFASARPFRWFNASQLRKLVIRHPLYSLPARQPSKANVTRATLPINHHAQNTARVYSPVFYFKAYQILPERHGGASWRSGSYSIRPPQSTVHVLQAALSLWTSSSDFELTSKSLLTSSQLGEQTRMTSEAVHSHSRDVWSCPYLSIIAQRRYLDMPNCSYSQLRFRVPPDTIDRCSI